MIPNASSASTSIKESVRIAQSNNFMGLICSSRLLDLVPALVAAIKEAGVVLIEDFSNGGGKGGRGVGMGAPSLVTLPRGVDGLLMGNAVLRFGGVVEQ